MNLNHLIESASAAQQKLALQSLLLGLSDLGFGGSKVINDVDAVAAISLVFTDVVTRVLANPPVNDVQDDPNDYLLAEYNSYARNVAEGDPMGFDDWLAGSDIPEIVAARERAKKQAVQAIQVAAANPQLSVLMGLLNSGRIAVSINGSEPLTRWTTSSPTGERRNTVATFTWTRDGYTFDTILDEMGITHGSWNDEGEFVCYDATDDEEVEIRFFELTPHVPDGYRTKLFALRNAVAMKAMSWDAATSLERALCDGEDIGDKQSDVVTERIELLAGVMQPSVVWDSIGTTHLDALQAELCAAD